MQSFRRGGGSALAVGVDIGQGGFGHRSRQGVEGEHELEVSGFVDPPDVLEGLRVDGLHGLAHLGEPVSGVAPILRIAQDVAVVVVCESLEQLGEDVLIPRLQQSELLIGGAFAPG